MKTEYAYLTLDANGGAWRFVGRSTEKASLSEMLLDGWRPVRETPFGTTGFVLILLERDGRGSADFGFGT